MERQARNTTDRAIWIDGRPIRPERGADESPVDYYKRTRCCPDDLHLPFNGKYYCNPAHCDQAFDSEEERNAHLSWAYSVLA